MRKIGWLCFILMWIPFSTWFISMLGLPNGSYSWSELPVLARFSMVLMLFFIAALIILLVGAPIVAGLSNRSVLAHGRPAEAKILKIWDTGTTVNNSPMVRMLLEVQPPGEPAFQAETERLVSRLEIPQIQPGNVVGVKYDPSSRAVALADTEEGGMSSM
jgi:hypothetical protein